MKLILLSLLILPVMNLSAAPFTEQTDDLVYVFEAEEEDQELKELLDRAESVASEKGRLVLSSARTMINNEAIVIGSCWDYIHEIYNRAGFPLKLRNTVFKSKHAGPYMALDLIKPGDWLYFINHSYGDVEHSGIFVAWSDPDNLEALLVSYSGGNNAVPARYKTYDLSSVYNVIRPK